MTHAPDVFLFLARKKETDLFHVKDVRLDRSVCVRFRLSIESTDRGYASLVIRAGGRGGGIREATVLQIVPGKISFLVQNQFLKSNHTKRMNQGSIRTV